MQYGEMVEGVFLERPNRFVARVAVNEAEVICHVKNTGRCRELLVPGAQVWLQRENASNRKTAYSLIAVKKGDILVNMDSQAPNEVVCEWLIEKIQPDVICRERRYGNSRFDLYIEKEGKKCYIEVKGVNLEKDSVALFPDAPTLRGVKHIRELIACKREGFDACILFVIQMKGVHLFRPNVRTQPEFQDALAEAKAAGVVIAAYDCLVTPDGLQMDQPVVVEI
jgi:sugar fermentation stimulation protein A